MVTMARTGDIIKLFDTLTTPPKKKWFLCIYVNENWLLRINTNPRIQGNNLKITKAENPFLHHDSHIDFTAVLGKSPVDIQNAENKGHVSQKTLEEIAKYLQDINETIPDYQKDKIMLEIIPLLPQNPPAAAPEQ